MQRQPFYFKLLKQQKKMWLKILVRRTGYVFIFKTRENGFFNHIIWNKEIQNYERDTYINAIFNRIASSFLKLTFLFVGANPKPDTWIVELRDLLYWPTIQAPRIKRQSQSFISKTPVFPDPMILRPNQPFHWDSKSTDTKGLFLPTEKKKKQNHKSW